MAKLSQTDFGTLLELASRADVEQIDDLQHFLSAAPRSRELILKMARKNIVARSIKDRHLIEEGKQPETVITGPKNTEPRKRGPRTHVGKPRKLEIIMPKGCKMNDEINYSLERFEKYMKDQGMKSAAQYKDGVKTMLVNFGMANSKVITGFALQTVRDAISGNTMLETNKRGQLKKFNEYLIFEYTQSR